MTKHSSDYIGLVVNKCEEVGLKGWPLTLGTDEAHAHELTGPRSPFPIPENTPSPMLTYTYTS